MSDLFRAAVVIAIGVILYRLFATPDAMDQIGNLATELARPVIIPLVNLLNAPPFVFIASTVMFLSAPVIAFMHWARVVAPQIRRIRTCEEELARNLPQTASGWTSWSDVEAKVSKSLTSHSLFITPWAGLTADVILLGRYPTKPFRAYVSEAAGALRTGRMGTIVALPGYYLSVGLLLTFMGLVVALYFASRGFRTGDMAQAREAIIQLLNASSFKFLTSVAALAASLLMSIYIRQANNRIVRAQEDLCDRIEQIIAVARDADRQGPVQVMTLMDVVSRLDRLIVNFEARTRVDGAPQPAPEGGA